MPWLIWRFHTLAEKTATEMSQNSLLESTFFRLAAKRVLFRYHVKGRMA